MTTVHIEPRWSIGATCTSVYHRSRGLLPDKGWLGRITCSRHSGACNARTDTAIPKPEDERQQSVRSHDFVSHGFSRV